MARGSTWVQKPRGENVRPQEGPGRLVHDPKPADFGLVGQWDVFGGVDLPGLMGRLGPRGGRPGPPPGRGVCQPGGPEPAADCLLTGPGELGLSLGENHPDQLGSPGRMATPQVEDSPASRLGMGMGREFGRAIAGDQPRLALVTAAFQEVTDRAWRQAEGVGQRSDVLTPGSSLPELLTHRDGDRLGHRGVLRRRMTRAKDAHAFHQITRRVAKPTERIHAAKPTER